MGHQQTPLLGNQHSCSWFNIEAYVCDQADGLLSRDLLFSWTLAQIREKNAGDLSRDSGRTGEKLYTPPKYNRKCLGCYFFFMETEAFIEQF